MHIIIMLVLACTPGTACAQIQKQPGSEPFPTQSSFSTENASLGRTVLRQRRKRPTRGKADAAYPSLTIGLRAGALSLGDSEAAEILGALPLFGADVKYHIGRLPLAVQGAIDYAFIEEDSDEISGGAVTDVEASLGLWGYRVSAVLEPPTGVLGTPGGGIYVTPYIGVGMGLHVLDFDVTGMTASGPIDVSVTDTTFGYHWLAGVDIVFGEVISIGMEAQWIKVSFTGIIEEVGLEEDLVLDGVGLTLSMRLHF